MRDALNRRGFMQCTAGAGALLASHLGSTTVLAGEGDDWPRPRKVKIHKIYAGRTGDEYLTRPTDELHRLDAYLDELATKLGDVEFVGGEMIPPAEVPQLAPQVAQADALLIVHLSFHGGAAPVLSPLIDLDLPTGLFTQPFSGHGWMYFPQWHKQGKKVVLLPTSDWSELDSLVRLMRVPARMRQTRILAVGKPKGTAAACSAEEVKKRLGADLVTIPNERILQAMSEITPEAAAAEAQAYWISQAREIVEPQTDEIIQSARMYLAVKRLMIQENAQAITSSHCMGDPRGCLTFSKLNDEGKVGACEGDVDSTLTMLLFSYAFGIPGFITDPVIDTAQDAMVHFHCTSATKLDGPDGERLPFILRNQTDTKGGVAVQVENRVGQAVTCAKYVNLDTMLVCPGTITQTGTSPLACRTQFSQRVNDAERLFLNWGADVVQGDMMTLLHRVVFYGDHTRRIRELGTLMGFRVIEEGGASSPV